MKLIDLQKKFAKMLPRLLDKAHDLGYEVTIGDAYRDPRVFEIVDWAWSQGYRDSLPKPQCHPKSLHKVRLAIDLNLFKDGRYIKNDEGHRELHAYWASLGGSPMIREDANHYSVEWDNVI